MSDVKRRVYRAAVGRPVAVTGALDVSWAELLTFLWARGGPAFLRGCWHRWRLASCGGRLLVGARVQLLFPKRLSAGRNVSIGSDSYVSALAENGVRLGNNVRIRERAWIQSTSVLDDPGVGVTIGDDTYIGPGVILGAGGGIRIGAHVNFGANVQLLAENHVFSNLEHTIQSQGVTRAGIVVEDDVWIGNSVIVLDGVTIGRGAVVGAGAVVTRSVPPFAIAAGNPARVIRQRSSELEA